MPSIELGKTGRLLAVALLSLACGNGRIDLFGIDVADGASVANGPEAGSADRPETSTDRACASDMDCSHTAPRCEPVLNVCVQCVQDSDCAGRNDSRCNLITTKCVLPCTTTSDCLAPDVCDMNQGWCADCLVDSQCAKTEPHCLRENCICLATSECPTGKTCWSGACVACVTTADCPTGKTCSTAHACQ